MAQATLRGPKNPRWPFNTADETVEKGSNPKTLVDAINANFDEVYASSATGVADAAAAQSTADAAAAAVAALDAAVIPTVGEVGDLKEIIGEGAPDPTAQAALTVNPAGDDNALTFTAVAYGSAGNDISIEYLDPEANDAVLSVGVVGTAITVNLATGVAGAITSTAADILAEVEATPAADALITVAIDATDSGVGDDGSGIVTAIALANLEDGAGVGIGTAGIGSRYTDITNGALYLNTGTMAVPVWEQLAFVA